MSILFAVIGVALGGMMFELGGAVTGGIIGWICPESQGFVPSRTA